MFNAIGAHIYAGGFTVGISKHFNVLAHLEHNGYGAEVVKLNFPDLPIYAGGPASWPKTWPKGAERPRFMYANPPCAIWSVAANGRACHWCDDPRLDAHHDIFNYALDTVGVDVLAIESVPPSFTKGREHVDYLIATAAEKGYSTTVVQHDTQWFGVPQSRRRIFYMFHKVEIPWEIPSFNEKELITVKQAFKGLPKKTKGYPVPHISDAVMNLLKIAKPGENLQRIYQELYPNPVRNERGQKIGSPSFLDRRAAWDRPAPVAINLYHPVECRQLNQEELAAICSFPQDYKWPKGGQGGISGYMNRGIMPKAGEWLARNVEKALIANRRINHPESMVLDVQKAPGRYFELAPAAPTGTPGVYVVGGTNATEAAAEDVIDRTPQLPAPPVHTNPVKKPGGSTVIVDWAPRICGATSWCGHVKNQDPNIELMSFSKSGRPLATWSSSFEWEARKISDAAAILNDYDRVILGDVVCFSPSIGLDAEEKPYYIDIMKHVTNKWTGIFHGGSYPSKHDGTIDAILSSPGFCGTLITPRIGQATERLAQWNPRFEHTPYLPYDASQAPSRRGTRGRTKSVMMTARVTSNKGQNAALILSNHINGDIDCWGQGQFGQPSPTWSLWELATHGLGYKEIREPGIRKDKPTITHPNARKFYTGAFEVEAQNGRRFRYRDGYVHLSEVDWSPWIHLSMASTDFAGILEYSVIDAVHCGAIAVVPECWPTEGKYDTIQTIPFENCTAAWDPTKGRVRETKSYDRDGVAKVINGLLKMSDKKLGELQDAQFEEFSRLHHPQNTLDAIDRALAGKTKETKNVVKKTPAAAPAAAVRTSAAMVPEPGEKSGAFIRRCLIAGMDGDAILAIVHSHFEGSKASKSDINWNKQKLKKEGIEVGVGQQRALPMAPQQPSAKQPKYAAPERPNSVSPPWEMAVPQPRVTKAPQSSRPSDDEIVNAIESLKSMIVIFVNNPDGTPAVKNANAIIQSLQNG